MFRTVRKENRAINEVESIEILKRCNFGVLGTVSEDGYPYALPLNYIYSDNAIYFHSGKNGHKIDNIRFSDKVSFTVVAYEDIDEEEVSTDYESVIVFGKAVVIESDEERLKIMKLIMKELVPSYKMKEEYIDHHKMATVIVKVHIEHITGKVRADKRNRM